MAVSVSEPVAEIVSTSNASSYAFGSFTPTANSVLVILAMGRGTTAVGSVSNTSGTALTWNQEFSAGGSFNAAADTMYCYWAIVPGSTVASVYTVNTTGDAATGMIAYMFQVTGAHATTPFVQGIANSATSTNATVTFGAARNTNNAYLAAWYGALSSANPANVSAPPTGWTEIGDNGFATPTTNGSGAYRAGGETATGVTFTNASTLWAMHAVEIAVAVTTNSCAGAITTSSVIAGALSQTNLPTGAIATTSTIVGALTVTKPLAGAIATTSTVAGALSQTNLPTGAITTGSTVAGALNLIKAGEVSDNFDDNSRDTAVWNLFGAATTAETGGTMQVTLPTTANAAGGYISIGTYTLINSRIFAQLVDPAGITNTRARIHAYMDASNAIMISQFPAGNINLTRRVGAVDTNVGSSVVFDALVHKWFRIREDNAGNVVGEYSTDGTTWTMPTGWTFTWSTYYSQAQMDAVKILLHAYNGSSAPASTETVAWDNLNVVVVSLAGAVTTSSTVTGALSVSLPLEGAITTSSTVTGALSQTNLPTGAISTSSVLVGALTVTKDLAGAVSTTSTVAGNLTQTQPLAGAITTSSTVVGALTVGKALAGAVSTSSVVTGALTQTQPLAGAITTSSTLTGALTIVKDLAGAVSTTSTVTGALTQTHNLTGAITTTSTVVGDLTLLGTNNLVGAIATSSTVTATLTVGVALSGTIAGASTVVGNLTQTQYHAGAISTYSTLTGLLTITKPLEGSIGTYATITGTLTNTPFAQQGRATVGDAWVYLATVSDGQADSRITVADAAVNNGSVADVPLSRATVASAEIVSALVSDE